MFMSSGVNPVLHLHLTTLTDHLSLGESSTPEVQRFSPLHLANALSACVLSARLPIMHRQWAAEQLLRTLALQGSDPDGRHDVSNCVDVAGDLPSCHVTKLEAHEDRVTSCVYHSKKSQLATRSVHTIHLIVGT